ncbi:hypothetical protein KJ359_009854 [Pestalotiopsis sp. 9143b]|nr:hypothetical protein KJ359_009854 [Pestalotiopsis sp. 9143b]
MSGLLKLGASLLTLSSLSAATPHSLERRDECDVLRTVKSWSSFTADEKLAYQEAAVCLTTVAPKLGIGNSTTLWQEMQYVHMSQVTWIHNVGAFLPWHRYYVAVNGNFLRDECGYDGPLAYWDESADQELSNLADADVFQTTGFGGDGVGTSQCIEGPFEDVVLHPTASSQGPGGGAAAGSTCIYRSLSVDRLSGSSYNNVETCLSKDTWEGAWSCIEATPHGAGHSAIGGLEFNVANSPGDPLFFLHHAFIDLLWWRWQAADLSTRLNTISGVNAQSQSQCTRQNLPCAGPDILDYNGDNGNVTTLNHVLWMMDISPNVTVADVMNTNSTKVCLDYVWEE